jgi:hypothetical protein
MRKMYAVLLMTWIIFIGCTPRRHSQGTLSLVSYSKEAGVSYGVSVDKNYAYVTNNDGVVIFDVHQPERPRKVGMIPTGQTFGICVENDLAYILGGRGLVIADIRDPANPKKLQECVIEEYKQRLQVEGSYAYIASDAGLEVLDVSDSGKISPIAQFGDSKARGVDVCDGIAYLAELENGVEVIDVTNPASPQKITTVAGTEGACDVHIHDEYLYVARHVAGIAILSITDRKSPKLVGSFHYDDGDEAKGVWGDGKYVFIAGNRIKMLDVSDPTRPYEIGEYSRRGGHDLCVEGKIVYVASGRKSLLILQFNENQER